MRLAGILTTTLFAALLSSGCANWGHGWSQEMQVDNIFRSAAHGRKNVNEFHGPYAQGWNQEFENWTPLENAGRGYDADVYDVFVGH